MRRLAAPLLIALLLAPPATAEDHAHLAEAGGVRVLHAWTRATSAGEAFVFAEIENRGTAERRLTGAEAEVAAVGEVVGFGYQGGTPTWTVLPGVPVAAAGDLHLEPEVLALRLGGLTAPLAEGGHLDLTFVFDGLEIAAEAEIGAADARAHSHAGHGH